MKEIENGERGERDEREKREAELLKKIDEYEKEKRLAERNNIDMSNLTKE